MNPKFWKDKKVLITGFEGFLGSHLTRSLLPYALKITGLDIKVRRRETLLNEYDYPKINVIEGSVADYGLLKDTIKRGKFDVIFHLAAEALVGKCYQDPLRTFSTNIKGAWNIAETVRHSGAVAAMVVASSDKAYGSHKKLPYTEKTSLEGNNPYDVSKSCADLISRAYAHSYGLPVAITRCGNIYGPGDFNFSRLVPDAMCSAVYGKKLLIRSDGKFTRDYIYVDDIVEGYVLLAENLKKKGLGGEAFNFSDENPLTVLELLKEIYKASGVNQDYKVLNRAKCEIRHQYLDSAKARRILRWRPKTELRQGLKMTFEWYRNFLKG